jgi:hypothetical protein
VASELRRLGWAPAFLILAAGVIGAFAALTAVGSD